MQTLADGKVLGSLVIEPLNRFFRDGNQILTPGEAMLVLSSAEISEYQDFHQVINILLSGKMLLFLNGAKLTFAISCPGFPRRQIEEPGGEIVLRGPREGFTEVLADNQGMVLWCSHLHWNNLG